MSRRRWALCLWALTALAALLLLVKFFVADVYRVDSGSMRPTLFGGRARADAEEDAEHVLVLYERGLEPERFDLVVTRADDGDKPLVKRVVGLPGDQDLMIRDGDLFIARSRLPLDAPRPPPIPVFDDRWLDAERFFEHRRDGSVERAEDAWTVRGDATPPGNLLAYHPGLRDDYLDREHHLVTGLVEVNDVILELEFALATPLTGQTLRFQLVEQGDLFELALSIGEGTRGTARLLRRAARSARGTFEPGEELAHDSIELRPGQFCRLVFVNVDNQLRARSEELGLDLRRVYDENEPWPARLPPGQKTLGPRVRFGVEAGEARFRAVRILRDLYYTEDGRFGVAKSTGDGSSASISLGPNDYFLLGDNSAASTDSRHIGPVKASQLLGRPVAVVWPDPRWLRPTAGSF